MAEALQCIDLKKLSDRFDNDKELLAEVAGIFIRETPIRLEKINAALEAGNIPAMVKLSHSLKGVCATMYAAPLQAKAFEVEMAARQGDLNTIRRAAPEMTAMLQELADALAGFISSD